MKSFAARARDALTRDNAHRPDTKDTRYAELTGLTLACGTLTLSGGGQLCLALQTEHAGTARWTARLLRRSFDMSPGIRVRQASRLGGQTAFEVSLAGSEARQVLASLKVSPLQPAIARACMKTRRSRDAFLRGFFLGCGTISDPASGYQMEFTVSSESLAQSIVRFLRTFYGLRAGMTARRQTFVVYLRESDGIIRVLSGIGAHGAILELENVRIMKEARNRANRAANCDSGNIGKMVSAADRQLKAIALIEEHIGLEALPDTLREIALERRLHPDASLETLGLMLDPPVGKSGIHHRLHRIEAMAQVIAAKEKEEDI